MSYNSPNRGIIIFDDWSEGNRTGHTRERPTLRRLTRACDHCRARKIKCDLRHPSCANCENRSVDCEFSGSSRQRGPKPIGDRVVRKRLGRSAGPSPGCEASVSPKEFDLHESDNRIDGCNSRSVDSSIYALQRAQVSSNTTITHEPAQQSSSSMHGTPEYTPQSPPSQSSLFGSIFFDLESAVRLLGLNQSVASLAKNCVDHFFDCLYPLMPIVYRPNIELGLSIFQPGFQPGKLDIKVFTLTAALCTITAAVIPSTIFPEGAQIADSFYHASKRSLDTYGVEDLEHPSSSSMVIRYFHSQYMHAAGKRQAAWHILGDAIRLAQIMKLHDEASYSKMDYIENQLCRRIFWVLFISDKSAGILGGQPITWGKYCFGGSMTVQYSDDFSNQDQILALSKASDEPVPSITTGFNFSQDLWRAAYSVLLEIDILRNRYTTLSPGAGPHKRSLVSAADLARLVELHLIFQTSLDNLPRYLSVHPTLSLSPSTFHFGQEMNEIPLPRTLAIQRTNLHISFQCLRLVILQAMPAIMDSSSPLWPISSSTGSSFLSSHDSPHPSVLSSSSNQSLNSVEGAQIDPIIFRNSADYPARGAESPAILLRKIEIAKSMLYVVHSSTLESLQLNGESCVEKIRVVGATMLEIIDHNSQSPLASTARQFRDLYPHILAHLDSKTSNAVLQDT